MGDIRLNRDKLNNMALSDLLSKIQNGVKAGSKCVLSVLFPNKYNFDTCVKYSHDCDKCICEHINDKI